VLNRTNDNLVAEYRYNGLGFRITEHVDTDTDGDVDGNDSIYHFAYDERWRIVSTYRDDDADPKELFVHHAAGGGGYGSSSYIDAVILRDVDLSTDWDAEANALDARHYYCQNWRADVSIIIDDSATIVERVMYSPYGVPFGIPAGDVANSSFGVPEDGIVNGFDTSVLLGAYSGSWNYCDLDNDGDVDADDTAIVTANTGNNLGWGLMSNTHNRFGYAGYVFDEALAGTKWHVRHRVLESALGRWIKRDPLGYVDGAGLSEYVMSRAVSSTDSTGLWMAVLIDKNFFECGGYSCTFLIGTDHKCGGQGVLASSRGIFVQKITQTLLCPSCGTGAGTVPVTWWETLEALPGQGRWTNLAKDGHDLPGMPDRYGSAKVKGEVRFFCLSTLLGAKSHPVNDWSDSPVSILPHMGCPNIMPSAGGSNTSTIQPPWWNQYDDGPLFLDSGSEWNCCCPEDNQSSSGYCSAGI
jgi:RHS repeat-associated protein